MDPHPPPAARRRALALAAALAALALLAALGPTRSRSPEPPAPLRQSRATSAASPARAAPAGGPEAPEAELPAEDEGDEKLPIEILTVYLRTADEGSFLFWPRKAELRPDVFWPSPEDLPEDPLAGILEEILAWELPTGHEIEREWVQTAADALPERPEDPGTALLLLELERRASDIDRLDAYTEAKAHLGPGQMAIAELLLGAPDTRRIEEAAAEMIDVWPEHPLSDIARLYAADAARQSGRPEDARLAAIDLLYHADDPVVAAQAAGLLSCLSDQTPLDPEALDRLGEVLDLAPDATAELDVASFGLKEATESGDRDRAIAWAERLEGAIAASCEDDPLACSYHSDNLDNAVAFLGLREPEQAADWRQGMKIAAFRCAAELDPGVVRVETHARWDGDWRFEPWDRGPAALTDCFEAEVADVPPPDDPIQIRVTILGTAGGSPPDRISAR